MSGGVGRRWTLLGVLAAVLNANFALEALLPGQSGVGRRVVSDLSLASQPWSWVFRLGDASSAVVLLVVALAMLRAGRRSAPWRVGAWLVAGFAAATLLSALVPLSCAATADSTCAGSPPGAPAPLANLLHDGASIAGTTAGILAAAVLALATKGRQSRAHWLAFALSAALGLALVVGAQSFGDEVAEWFGWVQRGQIVVLSLWFVAVGRSTDCVGAGAAPIGAGSSDATRR